MRTNSSCVPLNYAFGLTDGYRWDSRRLKNAEPVVCSRNMLFSQLEMIKYMHWWLCLSFLLRAKLKGNTPLDGQNYSKFAAISKVSALICILYLRLKVIEEENIPENVFFSLTQYSLYSIVCVLKSSAWLLIWSAEQEVYYSVNFPSCWATRQLTAVFSPYGLSL